jgi:hypothetical protein
MATVSGTIFRYGSSERIACATVKATSDGKVLQTSTDDDGDFQFTNVDTGKWSIVAFCEDSFPNAPVTIDVMADVKDLQIKLQRLAGQNDQAAGQKFFNWLLGIFTGLVIVYLVLHFIFPVTTDGGPSSFAIWDKDPWRYAEILLWGMAGVLINKIITVGWYLRSQKYYREGTIMHIAHLVVTPLLVFVAVAILSLVTLDITLAGTNHVALNLKDAIVLVAISFLLGTIPWPLWQYIENTAKKITG